MKVIRVRIADRVYVPRSAWEELRGTTTYRLIKGLFTKTTWNAHNCEAFSMGRPCRKKANAVKAGKSPQAFCTRCPQAKVTIKCCYTTKKYFAFDRGDKTLVKQAIALLEQGLESKGYSVEVVDKRVYEKLPLDMQYSLNPNVKMDKERFEEQKRVAKSWMAEKGGQIVAPPRFGKTFLSILLSMKSHTRVAIFAHQRELVEQFQKDFYTFTDLQEREKLTGRSLLAVNPHPDEVEKFSVCLYTWQQFASKYGEDRLKQVRKAFGLIIVDEAHRSSSDAYSSVLSRFWARYRAGVTATPKRRDQKNFRQDCILGPVIVEGGSEQLHCNYEVVKTHWVEPGYKEMNNRAWNLLWSAIAKAKDRNAFIVDMIKRDLNAGHKIIIPLVRISQIETLYDLLQKAQICDMEKVCKYHAGEVGSPGTPKRVKIANDIRAGKYDVVLGRNSMISLGFNAPPMSCIYLNAGAYHFTMDNAYQEYSRVRTVCKGKMHPLIRILADNGKISERSVGKLIEEMEVKSFTRVNEDGEADTEVAAKPTDGPRRKMKLT